MKHIVMFSGGIGSWMTAKRVADQHGVDDLLLVFADTLSEDDDLYRFLIEGAANVFGLNTYIPVNLPPLLSGAELLASKERRKVAIKELACKAVWPIPGLIWLIEGRDIWDVFLDVKFLGNSGTDPCSLVLKRQFLRAWVRATFIPGVRSLISDKGIPLDTQQAVHEAVRIGVSVDKKVRSLTKKAKKFSKQGDHTSAQECLDQADKVALPLLNAEREVADELTFYIGYDWTEVARWDKARRYWTPYNVECPLVEPPLLHKSEMIEELTRQGIEIPLLYRLNMPHNNCWGRCVKAGHSQWYRLLEVMHDIYQISEEMEGWWQRMVGSDRTILKDRRGGSSKPFSLAEFKLRWESYDADKKQRIREAWLRNFGVLPENLVTELQASGIDLGDTSGCGCFSGV